jgi:RNA polymerase sigma-70 factor (ECF subfamily)
MSVQSYIRAVPNLTISQGGAVQKINFRALVNDYGPAVLNTAIRILGDSQKAQDVHQEVFLAIWRRWHKYNGKTKWGAYLYRTTVRKAIEFAKRARNKQFVEQQPGNTITNERPDAPLRAAELKQKLVKCLGRLPKRQADVFVLSRIEGLQHNKIAEVLGCSQETVRVHLHRATKRLAHELSDYLG